MYFKKQFITYVQYKVCKRYQHDICKKHCTLAEKGSGLTRFAGLTFSSGPLRPYSYPHMANIHFKTKNKQNSTLLSNPHK